MSRLLDELISVEATMRDREIYPQTVTWRQQKYTVVSVGRQWIDAEGMHILVELNNGCRMEIVWGAAEWQLRRYWPPTAAV